MFILAHESKLVFLLTSAINVWVYIPAALKHGIRNAESGNGITETETETETESMKGSKRSI